LRSSARGGVSPYRDPRSDRGYKLGEGGRDAEVRRGFGGEFVVAAAEVLDEGVSAGDHRCRPRALKSPHRAEPGLQSAVVGFDAVVAVLLGDVRGGRDQATST
jgi:hypothetical protein